MDERRWEDVDSYLESQLLDEDAVLDDVTRTSREAGLPAIAVSPLQGKFLNLLAGLIGARHVLEVGTLGGYSAIWLGRALPPPPLGRLVTLELNPVHAEVAQANIAKAGLAETVEVRVGPALESLPKVAAEFGDGAFDLTFIDADKQNNASYFKAALKLTRPGGVIVVDNVVRGGAVADAASTDGSVVGTRKLLDEMAREPGIMATALQTVGAKGYDGFAIAIVEGRAGPS
jgi:predicted O-methyltransferase YrrM